MPEIPLFFLFFFGVQIVSLERSISPFFETNRVENDFCFTPRPCVKVLSVLTGLESKKRNIVFAFLVSPTTVLLGSGRNPKNLIGRQYSKLRVKPGTLELKNDRSVVPQFYALCD